MNNVVVSSSKGKGLSEVTPKSSSSNHTGLAPVANETPKPKQSHTLSNPAEEMSNPPIAPSQNEASGSLSPNVCLCTDYRYDPSCNSCHPQSPSKSQDVCSGLEASAASMLPFPGGIPKVENPSAKLQIPEPYPKEIVALQQSLNDGIPMKIVASSICPLLPIAFDSKIKFGFLGFFHVTDAHVQVDFVKVVQHRGKPQKRGRVTWRFTFEWIPGGVPPLLSNLSGFNGDAPWWDMSQTDIFPTSVPFTKRPDRFYPDELGFCLVPEYVLRDGGAQEGVTTVGCDVPCLTPIKEASNVRDSWRLSVVRPESKCPNGLTENVTLWNTGMQTLKYSVVSERPQKATVLHVFNCNLPALEKEADIIFKMFQGVYMEVVLDRPRTRGIAPTPRYRYTVGIPKSPRQSGQDSAAIDGPLMVQAGAAPDAITIFPATRDMMLSLAKTYIGGIPGHEFPGLEINWIEAMGWHEENKTKVPGIADAADAPVLFLCLGADIELIFDWKLGKRVKASGPPAKSRCATADKTTKANGTPKSGPQPHPIANSSVDVDEDPTLLSGTADDGDANSDVDAEDGAGGDEDSGTIFRTKSSVAKDTLHLMMTHGDLVMVTGGDLHVPWVSTHHPFTPHLSDCEEFLRIVSFRTTGLGIAGTSQSRSGEELWLQAVELLLPPCRFSSSATSTDASPSDSCPVDAAEETSSSDWYPVTGNVQVNAQDVLLPTLQLYETTFESGPIPEGEYDHSKLNLHAHPSHPPEN
ncbi:hypothetical protein BD410DRAFT_846955 [Rickenella mellea]|uniref:Uncharacterized protein n=1 Tax=Rickenella mellea TaxID=50990 RepID=A0A4Y7PEL1_9AGAM|nr:hypothetical protein BD410DRAFT_846955 [Rickenella mellea]